jgi:hypothetical protein
MASPTAQDKSTSIVKNTYKPFSRREKSTAKMAFILSPQAATIVEGSKNPCKAGQAFSEREMTA